jgi:hypothetical protein
VIERDVVGLKSIDISDEHVASIFRVEEYTKQEICAKAGGKQSSVPPVFAVLSCLASSTVIKKIIYSSETSIINGLHDFKSDKVEFLITTAVRTSNLTYIEALADTYDKRTFLLTSNEFAGIQNLI